jgi:phosphotriesterase-related protein
MKRVTTVLGDITPECLGFCQSHEHLAIAEGYPAKVHPDQRIDDKEKSRQELELFRKAGGSAVVDAQPLGCGRDAAMLEEISRESRIHIIASTGFHRLPFYPEGHWIYSATVESLSGLFVRELAEGMFVDCDEAFPEKQIACRAGQIKAAWDTVEFGPPDRYRKLFEAVSEAAKITGCALMVHIEKGSDPIVLADFLQARGVRPERVIFCHMDRSISDLSVHKELCARGIVMEYDTIARPKYHDDDREARIILEMVEAGWESRLLLSLDVTRARLKSYGGVPGLTYILESFIPLLHRYEISETQVRRFFVDNPAEVFAFGE